MKRNNLIVGVLFIVLGAAALSGNLVASNYKLLGIVFWSLFLLYQGVVSFKKNHFNMGSCVMIAISLGLLLNQTPVINTLIEGSYIKPLFLLAIGLSIMFGTNGKDVIKRTSLED